MKIEITKIEAAAISAMAAALVITAFLSGYRIDCKERRADIFDLECELKMYGYLVDSVYCGISEIKDILSKEDQKLSMASQQTCSASM